MLKTLFNRVFGTRFERELKRIQPIVDAIKQHEARLGGLPEDAIRNQTAVLRAKIREHTGTLEAELAARRRSRPCARPAVGLWAHAVSVTGQELPWDMVHYDVQLIGGIQLHLGRIAEMATGEGKTLVATLPLYLNALPAAARTW
jgi:preprotein translocase subunit SecA